MTQITKKKTGYQNAKLWRDSQQSASTTDPVIYIFIGNSVPWPNESSPPALVDTLFEEKATSPAADLIEHELILEDRICRRIMTGFSVGNASEVADSFCDSSEKGNSNCFCTGG